MYSCLWPSYVAFKAMKPASLDQSIIAQTCFPGVRLCNEGVTIMALFLAVFPKAFSAWEKFMSSSVVKFYPSSAVLRELLLPETGEEKNIYIRVQIYCIMVEKESLDCVLEIDCNFSKLHVPATCNNCLFEQRVLYHRA